LSFFLAVNCYAGTTNSSLEKAKELYKLKKYDLSYSIFNNSLTVSV